MKILYATMQYGRGYGQGTERYLTILSAGVRRRGHEALFLAGDPEQRGPYLALGETVQNDPLILAYPTNGYLSVEGAAPETLVPLLQRHKPDLVHLANPAYIGVGLVAAARTLGVPVIVTVMDYWWLCPKHTLQHYQKGLCTGDVTWRECLTCMAVQHHRKSVRAAAHMPGLRGLALPVLLFGHSVLKGLPSAEIGRWKRRRRILRDTLDAADAVIFPSQTARKLLAPAPRPGRDEFIPYGLEEKWFEATRRQGSEAVKSGEPKDEIDAGETFNFSSPLHSRPLDPSAPFPSNSSSSPENLLLGFAGALAEHKGPHVLLEAIRKLGWHKTRVRIAGGGTDTRYLARLRELAVGLNVEFVGQISSDRMPAFLTELDWLIVPSLWPENLPIIVLEAQALRVPVLAGRVDGIAELIADPRNLFDVGSAESLAECLRARLAENEAYAFAPVSTAEEMIERTLAVYLRVGRRA